MHAIVLAGGVPQEEDLLYEYTQGRPKALIDVAGKPMVQWVLEALDGVERISAVTLVGLDDSHGLRAAKVSSYLPDAGSMLANALSGTEHVQRLDPQARQVLMVGSDIPLLTSHMVDYLLDLTTDPTVDMYHSVVPRSVMEQRFPDSRRSYARLADGDFAAGDIHVIAPHIGQEHRELWDGLLSNRKSVIKQAMQLGPRILMKYAAGRLSIAELERRVEERIGIKGRALIVDYAEMGMDVDKPFQLEICRRELSQRAGL